MAKKISQLTQATEVKSDDVTVIVQDGETKKLPLNLMVTKQDVENKKIAGLAKLDEIEATYENDTYTPTITVKNKSSVKTGEGDEVDYSANVMDGHVKSAILTGQTLVNLAKDFKYQFGWTSAWDNGSTNTTRCSYIIESAKEDTKYLFKNFNESTNQVYIRYFSNESDVPLKENQWVNLPVIITTPKNTEKISVVLRLSENNDVYTSPDQANKNLVVEYQEGMENLDIPYFEGMKSVKMPVLKATGKNLFDGFSNVIEENGEYSLDVVNRIKLFTTKLILKANKTVTISYEIKKHSDFGQKPCLIYGNNEISMSQIIGLDWVKQNIAITPETDCVLNFGIGTNANIYGYSLRNIQIEEGSVATSYEQYKTNILTVNEDVTLRGVGDVQDELNCLTGEVTERIGEVVLNGSENWSSRETTDGYMQLRTSIEIDIAYGKYNKLLISDKLPAFPSSGGNKTDEWIIRPDHSVYKIELKILASRLESASVESFKEWLSKNPITVQYQLATESIKTVALIHSGTHPSTTPYCWKNGHIQLSSSGLLPSLEYSVVTSRAGQISQNAAMIVKNDKRIFDLEILLAGGLVNTTYQALTLQNQVETGLSKVSLSSEKEPDYLLYHMIMKLIEEKAYKLDDLAEKVSVFYLYEKLSDEQFETIYSELYPFVEEEYIELPEDGEIIEEPIVDEVLEEVENGVVM